MGNQKRELMTAFKIKTAKEKRDFLNALDKMAAELQNQQLNTMLSSIEYDIEIDNYSHIQYKMDKLTMTIHYGCKHPVSTETYKRFYNVQRLATEGYSDYTAANLLNEAKKLTKANDFKNAKTKLDEALLKAQYPNTKKKIDAAIEKNGRLQSIYDAKIEKEMAILSFKILEIEAGTHIRTEQLKKACETYTRMFKAVGEDQVLRNMVHSSKEKHLEWLFSKLKDKCEVLIAQKNFDEAKKCLKKASDVAHEPIFIGNHEIITKFNRTNNLCSNEEAKFLQTEAHLLMKQNKLEEAIIKIDAALKLANEYSTIQSLEIDKIKYSKRDNDVKKAKLLQETGNKYVKTNNFKEAIVSFDEALNFAHEESLIQSIMTDRINTKNKYAKFMQDEANKFVIQNKYEDAYAKFKDAYEEARDLALVESIKKDENDAKNKQIKFLQEVANKLVTENKFDAAYKNFEKALEIHGDISLIKSVKVDKAKAYNLQGSLCLKQAFDLDSKEPYTEQQAKEAQLKFNLAKDRFQKADETNHTNEYELNTEITIFKIYGDDMFNEALLLENDAYAIYEEAKKTKNEKKYVAAREKYREVLDAFTEAKRSFEEGLRLNRKEFKDSVKVASEQINVISKIVKGSDMVRMWCAFQNNEHLYAEMIKNAIANQNASSS